MTPFRMPLLGLFSSFFLLFSCSPARHIQREVKKSPVFNRTFTGFTLMDPETAHTLADVNGDHYFTPASNTKILTLYTCLKVLGDSVPALRYQLYNPYNINWLFIKGTGDPTFLHPFFQAWQAPAHFIKSNEKDANIILYTDTPA